MKTTVKHVIFSAFERGYQFIICRKEPSQAMSFSLHFILGLIFLMSLIESMCQSVGPKDGPGRQWSGYRGILAGGVLDSADLPESWNVKEKKNIKWMVELPGLGLSCPVIWETKVFITSAINRTDTSGLKTGQLSFQLHLRNGNLPVHRFYSGTG